MCEASAYLGVPRQRGDALARLHVPQLHRVVERGAVQIDRGVLTNVSHQSNPDDSFDHIQSKLNTNPENVNPKKTQTDLAKSLGLLGFSDPGPVGDQRMV
jgi:hypothetical protein